MSTKDIHIRLKNASYDLKFLLNRGYKKKVAVNLVANKYVLNKDGRNYLIRKIFSDDKSRDRSHKIININHITNKTIIIDGYNVLISVEAICNREYSSLIMCDDGLLRDLKAVFGKYKINSTTEIALNNIIGILGQYNPAYVYFFYDSPVSKSGELALITNDLIQISNTNGCAVTHKNVDLELVKQSKKYDGIVATSDGPVIDKVNNVLDIPCNICKTIKYSKEK
jgi:hypothetical protein